MNYRFLFCFYSPCYIRPSHGLRTISSNSLVKICKKNLKLKIGDQLRYEDNDPLVKKTKYVNYNAKQFKDISDYFDSKPNSKDIISKLPTQLMIRTYKYNSVMYCVDRDVASEIYKTIKPFIKSAKGHILEVNAGCGLLTKHLLKSNIQKLIIYEKEPSFQKELYSLVLNHKSNAKLIEANLLTLCRLSIEDRDDGGSRVASVFEGIPSCDWEDDPVMNMIITVAAENFLLYMMYSIIFQSGVCCYGRPQLFVVMSPTVHRKLMCTPNDGPNVYRGKSVVFQILFEHKVLLKVPEKAFLPWLKQSEKKKGRLPQLDKEDEGKMFLVKLTARKDLFHQISPDLTQPLWFFIRTLMFKRKAGLIAMMEKWVPGCGPRLIARGYTIFTQCGSLTPQEYLELFQMFTSWPEFKSSSFMNNTTDFIAKLTEAGAAEEMFIDSLNKLKSNTDCESPVKEDEYDEQFENLEVVQDDNDEHLDENNLQKL